MLTALIIFFGILLLIKTLPKAAPTLKPTASNCPPHEWSWENVYNEDGSLHHQHMVCAKCGPIHGEKE